MATTTSPTSASSVPLPLLHRRRGILGHVPPEAPVHALRPPRGHQGPTTASPPPCRRAVERRRRSGSGGSCMDRKSHLILFLYSLSDGSEQRSAMRCGVARLPRAPRRWRGKGRTRARARERIAVDGLVSECCCLPLSLCLRSPGAALPLLPCFDLPPFPTVSWISRIQTTALVSLPSCLLPAYVQEGPWVIRGFRCCWICRAGADGDDRRRAEAAGKGQRRPRPKDQFPVGMRVLAVDDDPTCLKVLENLLFRCQYHVTTMGQAATALSC
ncbi:ubiquitin carrier protein 7 [Zea mays]|uniref:Ubiquitin carrier protein 7 n=1 Tax=Zea mays TaxID=4577 RepID=A0A1D6EQD8_MAIZE|nr:ubiquitin carrier protein 7 [Zea mays]